MDWLKLHSGLRYDQAMLKARKIQRDEAKLKTMGGQGNYSDVCIRLSFDGPGRKEYSVYVKGKVEAYAV